MKNIIDLTGQRFGRLVVIKRSDDKILPCGQKQICWLCRCDCGKEIVVRGSALRQSHTKSCGCISAENLLRRNIKHNKRDTRLYQIWAGIKTRCYNKKNSRYNDYGGRGITICEEWRNDFQAFYDWAISNGYRDDLTIDRIDNNGNYDPSNCRWSTFTEQANNTRRNHVVECNGETKTLAEWSRKRKISYSALKQRINKLKLSPEQALEFERNDDC